MKFRNTEGRKGLQDLCDLVELLGYRGGFQQLLLDNGSAVSSLINFLEDNPGAIQSLYDWIEDNFADELAETDDENESEFDESD